MKESKFDFIDEDIVSSTEKYEDIISNSSGIEKKESITVSINGV